MDFRGFLLYNSNGSLKINFGIPAAEFANKQLLVSLFCGRNSVVERQLPKLKVVGSNPIARFSYKPF